MEGRVEKYQNWLAGRQGDFVDNSREHIINLAMDDIVSRNNIDTFDTVIIKDYEAALWMSQNMQKLNSEHTSVETRKFLEDILTDEIKYMTGVNAGTKEDDGKERPSIKEMNAMVEILKKPANPMSNMNEVDGGRRRTKHSKKHSKKSRKTKKSKKSRRHSKKSRRH